MAMQRLTIKLKAKEWVHEAVGSLHPFYCFHRSRLECRKLNFAKVR